MGKTILLLLPAIISGAVAAVFPSSEYEIVDTGQDSCYSAYGQIVACSETGQDGAYAGNQPRYADNGDGTVADTVTGLMWQQDPGSKMTYEKAAAEAPVFKLAGYDDWRLPSIKELYSLILFSGEDPSGETGNDTWGLTPYIDANTFVFNYGDPGAGERIIDSQYASSTKYVSTTMDGKETDFGVNFADGRIKGYGLSGPAGDKTFYVMYVRGNENYGMNNFKDNGDGTITDSATGLMWMADDSGAFGVGGDGDGALDWRQALDWCEDIRYAGYSDWRLPDAKELQSIVDYTRSPATTGTAAIDPVFNVTPIIDEGNGINFPFYWTSTTHVKSNGMGDSAVYIAFGEALGWMRNTWGQYTLMDVHGAGAQRSDPKSGDPADYPYGHGPQGDVVRIYNYARCVRSL